MFLQDTRNGDMVEILDFSQLYDPLVTEVHGRYHAGEEMPESQSFPKVMLRFPSGEGLPSCWLDPDWRR